MVSMKGIRCSVRYESMLSSYICSEKPNPSIINGQIKNNSLKSKGLRESHNLT